MGNSSGAPYAVVCTEVGAQTFNRLVFTQPHLSTQQSLLPSHQASWVDAAVRGWRKVVASVIQPGHLFDEGGADAEQLRDSKIFL